MNRSLISVMFSEEDNLMVSGIKTQDMSLDTLDILLPLGISLSVIINRHMWPVTYSDCLLLSLYVSGHICLLPSTSVHIGINLYPYIQSLCLSGSVAMDR